MKKILVIRSFDEFSRILTENDFEIINLPVVETKPIDDLSDFEAKLKTADDFDGIFLTSKNAAQVLVQKLDELSINYAGKVYVLGKRSFEILQSKNLDLVFFETANTAEEMLEKIPLTELRNKRFLFVRGEKSLATIPNYLSGFATIDESIVYGNEQILLEPDTILEIYESIEKSEIEAVCFFSPSGAETFLMKFGAEILHQTIIATIGKTTADFFERQNLTVDFVSPKASAEDFAFELVKYLKEDLPTKYTKKRKA